jgi:transcriptional regulator with XRE-family HTH domain
MIFRPGSSPRNVARRLVHLPETVMFTHDEIWRAIDDLAEAHSLSTAGLARKAGLTPTAFNKSRRITANRHEHWPSMQTVARILEATGEPLSDFGMRIVNARKRDGEAVGAPAGRHRVRRAAA